MDRYGCRPVRLIKSGRGVKASSLFPFEVIMDLGYPVVFPCWERFADGQKLLCNSADEYHKFVKLHGRPLVYAMMDKAKAIIEEVNKVTTESDKIIKEAIEIATKKKGGKWKTQH